MSTEYVADGGVLVPEGKGLSQIERVVDTFIAPSKTFTDILRDASWWLPFLLMLILSMVSAHEVDKQVGFDRVAQTQMESSPRTQDMMSSMDPAQKTQMLQRQAMGMKFSMYGFSVLLVIIQLIYSLFLWASFNFGLGATTQYKQVLAVTWYASLPYIFSSILMFLTVKFGNADGFNLKNPVGTNLGYYVPDASPVVRGLLSSLDVVKLWSVVLQVIGMAIIAKKTIAQSAVIVGIFWVLGVLLTVVGAMFS